MAPGTPHPWYFRRIGITVGKPDFWEGVLDFGMGEGVALDERLLSPKKDPACIDRSKSPGH